MVESRDIDRDIVLPKTEHVAQGGFKASADPSVVLTTLLGSCVCTCLCDPVAGVGGMNHFLLPDRAQERHDQLRYGLHAMELLINNLLSLGAQKHRLEAKVFGGAGMQSSLSGIGDANGRFALKFLTQEGLLIVGHSLGGTAARRIRYWPTTGKAQQMFLKGASPNEASPQKSTPSQQAGKVAHFD